MWRFAPSCRWRKSPPMFRANTSCCGAAPASTSCIIRCATARSSTSSRCFAPDPCGTRRSRSHRAELEHTYRDTHPAMQALIGMMDLRWRRSIGDRDPVRHWHKGRVVLLGDAAHAPLQSLAQGAGMAIEDGLCLANDRSGRTAIIRPHSAASRPRDCCARRGCSSNPVPSGNLLPPGRRHRAGRAQRHRGRLGRGASVRLPGVAL